MDAVFFLLLSNQNVKSGTIMTVSVKLLTFLYLLEFLVRLHMSNICLIKPVLLYHDLCMDLIDIDTH